MSDDDYNGSERRKVNLRLDTRISVLETKQNFIHEDVKEIKDDVKKIVILADAVTKNSTDIKWIKGIGSVAYTSVLACVGWIWHKR